MEIIIKKGDITKFSGDVIVNAVNTDLKAGGGVCGAIFNVAGKDKLQQECDKLAPISVGEAVITKGYGLFSKYIIHTPGPIYHKLPHADKYLASCYYNSLKLADENFLCSIAFPCISTGTYGYPSNKAAEIAIKAIKDYELNNSYTSIKEVNLIAYDEENFNALNKAYKLYENKNATLLKDVHKYLEDNLVMNSDLEHTLYRELELDARQEDRCLCLNSYRGSNGDYVDDIMSQVKKISITEWANAINKIMDERGYKPSEVYHRAGISKSTFSNIMTSSTYSPSKETAVKMCIGLKLNYKESQRLLKLVGYVLSDAIAKDVVVTYFINNHIYDMDKINDILFKCHLDPFSIK